MANPVVVAAPKATGTTQFHAVISKQNPIILESEPHTVTADATVAAISVKKGFKVLDVEVWITTLLAGGVPAVQVGDGGDPNRYFDAADITEGAVGITRITGARTTTSQFTYLADDNIDIDLSGSPTSGVLFIRVTGVYTSAADEVEALPT